MKKEGFAKLAERVIKRGLCTACGTCIGVCQEGALEFDNGREEPRPAGQCASCGRCLAVCPGEDIPIPKLEKMFLGTVRSKKDEILGVSKRFLKGYAADPAIRSTGASGGATTALLLYALEKGLIEGATGAGMDPDVPWRVKPVMARTSEEIRAAAKSKYVVCPNNAVLREAREMERFAVVGLPCHVHGIRKMQQNPKFAELAEKISFVIGICCGSNRSYKATELVIQERTDAKLEEISLFEYRGGKESQDITIHTQGGKEYTIPTSERRTLFQAMTKDRCRMCCDWSAELADLSLGDIFDPSQRSRKIPDWNSIIIRTEKGLQLVEKARKAGIIELFPLEEDSFYSNVGINLKKHGAVYTRQERKHFGWPVPDYHYEFNLGAVPSSRKK